MSPGVVSPNVRRKLDGARTVYVLWGASLALLVIAGTVVWCWVIPYCQVRRAALQCQGFDPPWDVNPARAGYAVEMLGGPEKAIGPLSWYMRLPPRFATDRPSATAMLGLCGPQVVPDLLRLLHDPEDYVRAQAAITLGRMQDSRGYEPLLAVLKTDQDPYVRGMAAVGLGHYGDGQVFEVLLAMQQTEEDLVARRMASQAMGLLKDPRAVDPLITQLSDPDGTMRCAAAWALGHIGDRRAEALLDQLAADDDEEQVRTAAAEALKKMRDEAAKAE